MTFPALSASLLAVLCWLVPPAGAFAQQGKRGRILARAQARERPGEFRRARQVILRKKILGRHRPVRRLVLP